MLSMSAFCQRKEIAQAKVNVKDGKNLAQAEQSMAALLADSANRGNEKIWLVLFDAIRKQVEEGNEKFYLKQKYDTAQLFTLTRKMFVVLEGLDSLDAMVSTQKQSKLRYRKKHAEILASHRLNVFNGGAYFMRKGDYSSAYDFFDTYVGTGKHPLFSGYNYADNDPLLPRAAYMAVYCGMKQCDAEKALRHKTQAENDTAHWETLYQYLAETYRMKGDSIEYMAMLEHGARLFPTSMYFFPRLFDAYYDGGDMASAQRLAEHAMQVDTASAVFRYAAGSVYLSIGRYDDCIELCEWLIERDDRMGGAYLNAGLAYYNKTLVHPQESATKQAWHDEQIALYRKAMPYLQRSRLLLPAEKDKWGMPLYSIYFNLNMGKEFDEIEALLQGDADK